MVPFLLVEIRNGARNEMNETLRKQRATSTILRVFFHGTKPAGRLTWNNGEQSCERGERAVGRLRLVVMRSHSEDERPDVVHWANASHQTGKISLFSLYNPYFDLALDINKKICLLVYNLLTGRYVYMW